MKLRRVVSLTALLSFLLVILTSVILFIVPQGRVAYWADWRLWGLSKIQWTEVHINLGLLFLLALLLHAYYNWRQITAYMKDKAKNLKIFTPDFNMALALTVVFLAGTLAMLLPFSSVIDLNEWFKDEAAAEYGEPPYGHAELSSLKTFSRQVGLDLDKAMHLLGEAGIEFQGQDQSLVDIANANRVAPQGLYEIMKPAEKPRDASAGLPEDPPAGTGNRTLADLVQEYGLFYPNIERALREKGVQLGAEMTIKQIGELNGKNPMDVYAMIREAAQDE